MTKPIREMTALDLLETHAQALQAQNERLCAALQEVREHVAANFEDEKVERICSAALSGDGSVSQPTGDA